MKISLSMFRELSVLVVADICLERDCIVKEGTESCEEIEGTAQDIVYERWHPGGGGNLAANFAALGAKTTVVGTWGGWYKDFLEYSHLSSARQKNCHNHY